MDARLSAVCLKALAKRPADRHPTMAAFAAALDDWLVAGPDAAARPRPRRGAAVVVFALALLVVAGLLAWRPWVRQVPAGGDPPPPDPGPPAAARDPAGAGARAELAWKLNDAGDLDRAVEHSTAALTLDDRCVSALQCRANARIKLGQARAAVGGLERAVELNPRDHDLEVDLAWAHNVLADHHTSLAHADRALARKKDSAEAHCQRGEALRELGRHPEAVAAFTEAVRLKPGYETAYRERALAYAALGEDDLARKDEQKADELKAAADKK